MKRYQAIIFDLDGVLISTDEQHYQGWKALADRLGIPFDRTANNRFRGVSRMECMDILAELGGRDYTDAEKLEYAAWKNERYRTLLADLSPDDLRGEVKDTLDALRSRGYLLSVGSSSKNSRFILERIGLGSYFDAVADGNDITRSKPDPEVFLKAAEKLGMAPEQCLVVEDAMAGVQAAHAGGMQAAAVGDAAANGCGDYLMSSVTDLLDILD